MTIIPFLQRKKLRPVRGEVIYLKSWKCLAVEPGDGPRLKDTPNIPEPQHYEAHSPFKPVELN